MPRSDYTAPTFIDVAQAQWGSPPTGAVALDAAHVNAMAQAIGKSAVSAIPGTDRVMYVSKTGDNSNDGSSWGAAKLTIGAALAALPSAGTIVVGNGVYQETLVPSGNKTIRGQSRHETVLELTTNGNLVDLTNQSNVRFEHIGFRFASSSATGNLLYFSNGFTCDFFDVRLSGTKTTGQAGVSYTANAGDCHFTSCYFDTLDTAVLADSTLFNFIGCMFSNNVNSVVGGDPTGAKTAAGAAFTQCTFRGAGSRYIWLNGKSQAWSFDGCWFDGAGCPTAIEVGSTGATKYGPWMVSITNSASLLGSATSLVLNKCEYTQLHGVAFTDDGHHPVEITIPDLTQCPRGSIAGCYSVQGTQLETKVPAGWKGAVGYVTSADTTVTLVETYDWMGVPSYEQHALKRITVRVANRGTSTAAATLTFPTAFETTFAGGQFFKTFDNSGTNPTISNTSITIPTGVACASGLITIEGF